MDCDILKGKNKELKNNYTDDNFRYSCPCCRNKTKARKRSLKEANKRKPSAKADTKSKNKRRCVDNNDSGYSNSVENETSNYKNGGARPESNLQVAKPVLDEEMVDESYSSHTDNGRKNGSEVDADGMRRARSDSQKVELKRRKPFNKRKSGNIKSKRLLKMQNEEQMSADFHRPKETVAEFTLERSRLIAKDRIDIVESRTL